MFSLRSGLVCTVLLLLTALAHAQRPEERPGRRDRPRPYFDQRPALGETAPDFVLRDLDGKAFRLKDAVGKRPLVIEFGSYT
jgi:hypothetical protein